jgi:diguanylate cyclase (GGDEF)-like protein
VFTPDQPLNAWVEMLRQLYSGTQNYAKSEYELHTHLVEVTGAFGKYLLKRREPTKAIEFLPKIFAWAVALMLKVKGNAADLEEILLTKFPRVCPYCRACPCTCWSGSKPKLDHTALRSQFLQNALKQKRGLDDFQMMFASIYGGSWIPNGIEAREGQLQLFARLTEETSELAEAVRYNHLYPSNFDNELADLLAWWIAIASTVHLDAPGMPPVRLSSALWRAYPGYCSVCGLNPCDCRPGPVRELLSKPALGDLALIDGLTQALNRASFDRDLHDYESGNKPLALPAVCVRIDVDLLRNINTHGHNAGDEALLSIVTALRNKLRTRDRVYRVGGDEFAVICPDLSVPEAVGMLSRAAAALKASPLHVPGDSGTTKELPITLSIGVSICEAAATLNGAFAAADAAAIQSKGAGKDRITDAAACSSATTSRDPTDPVPS